ECSLPVERRSRSRAMSPNCGASGSRQREPMRVTRRSWPILPRMRLAILLMVATTVVHGQWQIQDSHTHASLRGIHYVGHGVAWASGTGGTVLRTTNNGKTWQLCSTPVGGEALDFRAVQGFDANTAMVTSAGKGDLSRIYKTTDACTSWKLVLTNPDGP